MRKFLILTFCLLFLESCSAASALSSRPEPAIDDIGYGSTQYEVEAILGFREKTLVLKSGSRVDYYHFKGGSGPSLSRGLFHGSMVLGLGPQWELIGRPFEEFYHRKKVIAITYNRNNMVIDIQTNEISDKYN